MSSRATICLGCGAELRDVLAGSLRCHRCREAHAPLLAKHARRRRAKAAVPAGR